MKWLIFFGGWSVGIRKMNIFWGMIKLWIFWGSFIYISGLFRVKVQNCHSYMGLLNFKYIP